MSVERIASLRSHSGYGCSFPLLSRAPYGFEMRFSTSYSKLAGLEVRLPGFISGPCPERVGGWVTVGRKFQYVPSFPSPPRHVCDNDIVTQGACLEGGERTCVPVSGNH